MHIADNMKHKIQKLKLFVKIKNWLKADNYKLSASDGYTLVEMMAVIFIISMLSGMTLYNFSVHKKDEILLTETQKLAQFLRRAQNLALAPQQLSVPGTSRNGYGVRFSVGINDVFLFTDQYPTGTSSYNFIYDGGTERIEKLALSPDVTVSVLQAPAGDGITSDEIALNVLYIPPDPTVTIYNGTINTNAIDALITIRLVSDPTKFRKIKVSAVGLVEMQ